MRFATQQAGFAFISKNVFMFPKHAKKLTHFWASFAEHAHV